MRFRYTFLYYDKVVEISVNSPHFQTTCEEGTRARQLLPGLLEGIHDSRGTTHTFWEKEDASGIILRYTGVC